MCSKRIFLAALIGSGVLHGALAWIFYQDPERPTQIENVELAPIRIILTSVQGQNVVEEVRTDSESVPDSTTGERDPTPVQFEDPRETAVRRSAEPPPPESIPEFASPAAEDQVRASDLQKQDQSVQMVSEGADSESSFWTHVREEISRYIRYPDRQRMQQSEDTVRVYIVIDQQGRLVECRTMEAANRRLAAAVLRAVRRAAPFTPPEEFQFKGSQWTAELPVTFRHRWNNSASSNTPGFNL